MDYYIETHQLTKKYKHTLALDSVNLHVKRGAIYGLIGRNGAGKTTLLNILSQHIHPTSGQFKIGSESSTGLNIGSTIESPGLYPHLNAYNNMKLKCQAMGIRRPHYIEDLLELVELDGVSPDKKAKNYSLGMKQRLALALALVGDPDILFLDEPTNGLDPQGISDIRQLLLKLNHDRQLTIIISSHILDELSRLVTDIGIIHEGKLIQEISKKQLMDENRDCIVLHSDHLDQITAFLSEKLNIDNFQVTDQRTLEIYDHIHQPEAISHPLIQAGLLFDSFCLQERSLEKYFFELTGGHHYD